MLRNRRWFSLSLAVIVVLLAAVPTMRSAGASPLNTAASAGTKCKTVTKQGHKKKICRKVTTSKPRPTPTPAPIPFKVEVSARPCVDTSDPQGCADAGFTLTSSGGVITLSHKDLGYTIQLSKFGIEKTDSFNTVAYSLYMYVKAIKRTPKDGSLAPWSPWAYNFSATAANGHPYRGRSCGNPSFPGKDIYNGEWEEGWVCSAGVDPHYVVTTFTWSFEGTNRLVSPFERFDIPFVDVKVTPR